MNLTLVRGHDVSVKQNILASFFLHASQLIKMKFDVVLQQFKWNILVLILSEIKEIKGNGISLNKQKTTTTTTTKTQKPNAFGCVWTNLFQT